MTVNDIIFANVCKAMQDAEEIWGCATVEEYEELMTRIIKEAQDRINVATGRA
jgi:hypothetical protein